MMKILLRLGNFLLLYENINVNRTVKIRRFYTGSYALFLFLSIPWRLPKRVVYLFFISLRYSFENCACVRQVV